MKRQIFGVEQHNALGVGELYHAFLRLVFEKVKADAPDVLDVYALAFAVKAVNDSAGPQGLGPTLFSCVILPRMLLRPWPFPDNHERMSALPLTNQETKRLVSRARLKTDIASRLPTANESHFEIGDEVLWYREKRIEKWIGPCLVIGRQDQLLQIDVKVRTITALIERVVLYVQLMSSA